MLSVRTLVKTGHAEVNHETRAGKTPLIEAARHGRTAVVRLLMELRAVISYKNRRGQTATWWANRLGHHDCVLLMTREVKAETTLRLMSSQIGGCLGRGVESSSYTTEGNPVCGPSDPCQFGTRFPTLSRMQVALI